MDFPDISTLLSWVSIKLQFAALITLELTSSKQNYKSQIFWYEIGRANCVATTLFNFSAELTWLEILQSILDRQPWKARIKYNLDSSDIKYKDNHDLTCNHVTRSLVLQCKCVNDIVFICKCDKRVITESLSVRLIWCDPGQSEASILVTWSL